MTKTAGTWAVLALTIGCTSAGNGADAPSIDAGVRPATAAVRVSSSRARAIVSELSRFEDLRDRLGRGGRIDVAGGALHTTFARAKGGLEGTLPVAANAPLHLGVVDDDAWIDVTAEGLAPVTAEVDEGAVVYPGAATDTDLVEIAHAGTIEELRVLRSQASPKIAQWSIHAGPAIASVRAREGRIEAVDGSGRVRIGSAPIYAVDAKGTRRDARLEVRRDGAAWFATATLDFTGLELPIVLDPIWTTVASMTYKRNSAFAASLSTGKVLVVGGSGSAASPSTSELYDATANTWSVATIAATGASVLNEGWLVQLPGDRVLVGGGSCSSGGCTYLWDPAGAPGGTWTQKADLPTNPASPVALPFGTGALVVGGWSGSYLKNAQYYDPTGNTWSAKAPMALGRYRATGYVSGSQVYVLGGYDGAESLSSVEVWDSTSNTWSNGPNMAQPRFNATTTILPSGQALIVGGSYDSSTRYSSAEVFSPTSGGSVVASMSQPRMNPVIAKVGTSGFLVVGAGETPPYYGPDFFDYSRNQFFPVAPMNATRDKPVAGAISATRVLVAGGADVSSANTAEIFQYAPLGTACSTSAPCAVGTCVDGYCCNTACTEQCKACNLAGALGTCTNVTGEPPHGSRASCSPYVNCSAGACATSCTADAQCASAYYCTSTSGGTCAPKKSLGTDCGATKECQTGLTCVDGVCCGSTSCPTGASCALTGYKGTCKTITGQPCLSGSACGSGYCVDGVCCSSSCNGVCEACSATKKGSGADGACGAIKDGTDPDKECPAASCSGDSVVNAQVCNGSLGCRAAGTTACGTGYTCVSGACKTSCTGDTDCARTHYCVGGSCVIKKDIGAACTAGSECGTSYCIDGVCCDTACDGCKACSAALKGGGANGVCGNVAADSDPHNACAPDSAYPTSCKQDGMCDGTGKCRDYAKTGTACGETTCADATVKGKTCNGAGLCETSAGTSCAPYACGSDGKTCGTSCTSDTQCAPTAFCSAAGTCITKKAGGETCDADKQCGTGHCVDSVCCDTACDGQCQACDVSGKLGLCTAVTGKPHGKRTACTGDGTTCGGTCDGATTTACSYPSAATSCGTKCASDVETRQVCDGKGACIDGSTSKCLPYVCDGTTKCLEACAADSDCASGFKCSSGKCAPASNKCNEDQTQSIDGSGIATPCGAYKCNKSVGTCFSICNASEECAAGNVCNPTTKACEPAPAGSSEDSGGCTTSGRSTSSTPFLFAALAGLALAARRRSMR